MPATFPLAIMNEYIYDMPYGKHLALQRILDVKDQWKDLASEIGIFKKEDIDLIALDSLKPGQSPTNHLLIRWGQLNPTVGDLFFHLKAMKHDQALNVLRGLVPDKYFIENAHQKSYPDHSLKSDQDDLTGLPLQPLENNNRNAKRTGNLQEEPPNTPVPPYDLQENTWKNDSSFSSSYSSDQNRSQGAQLLNSNLGTLHDVAPRFTYNELCEATDNFSKRNMIGCGGFGTVYYGKMNRLRQEVAVKELKKKDEHELEVIFRCRHTNIIQLLGFCETDTVYCLVYDYMKNGSLLDRLLCKGNTPPLTWFMRMKILFGASKGIYYLHSFEKPIIHGDIKSANILIDGNFEAKIADFGLAKQANSGQFTHVTHVSQRNERVCGSKDYLPDDYLEDTSQLRREVDTFSFGIVIFETCLGVKAGDVKEISKGQFTQLKDLVNEYKRMKDYTIFENKFKDPKCQNWPSQFWTQIIRIGFTCTARSKKRRPSMDKVLDELEQLMLSAQINQQQEQQVVSLSSASVTWRKGLQHPNTLTEGIKELTIADGKKVYAGQFQLSNQKPYIHGSHQKMIGDSLGRPAEREKACEGLQKAEAMKEFEETEQCILAEYYDQPKKEEPLPVVNQQEDQINWYSNLTTNDSIEGITAEIAKNPPVEEPERVKAQPNIYIKMPTGAVSSHGNWPNRDQYQHSGSEQVLYQQTQSNSKEGITVKKTGKITGSELLDAKSIVYIDDINSSGKGIYLPDTADSSSDLLREKKKKKIPNLPPRFAKFTIQQKAAGQASNFSHQPQQFGPVEHIQSELASDNLETNEN